MTEALFLAPSAPPRRARYRTGALWVMVGVLAALGAGRVWGAWREISGGGFDLQADYLAGRRIWRGQDIYAAISSDEISALGVNAEAGQGVREYMHPPTTALLFAPLALLPFSVAALLWTVATVAFLLASILLIRSTLALPTRGAWLGIALLLPLEWYPVWYHLNFGQLTILVSFLVVAAWRCERQGCPYAGGAMLGLAVMLKVYPGLLLAYALVRGRWRVVCGAALAVLGVGFLQIETAGLSPWLAFVTRVIPKNAAIWMPHPFNDSLAGLSLRLFVGSQHMRPVFSLPRLEIPFRIGLYAATLGAQALVLWRSRRRPDLTGEYCLGLSSMTLLSPLSWDHAMVLLLLPFAYIWQQARQLPPPRPKLPLVGAGLAGILSFVPAGLLLNRLKESYGAQPLPPSANLCATGVPVLLLGFVAVLALLLRRREDGTV
jgi:uncharacterized membrane protein